MANHAWRKDKLIYNYYKQLLPYAKDPYYAPSIITTKDGRRWKIDKGIDIAAFTQIRSAGSSLEMRIFTSGELATYFISLHGVAHREDGPACFRSPGCYQYCIRGVEVPRNVVLYPTKQTIDAILNEGNSERQRIRIERYSWIKFLKKVNAEAIDTAVNDVENTNETLFSFNYGRAWSFLNGPNGRNLFFKVFVCACPSTGRVYALNVPSNLKTCEATRRWLMGKRLKDVKLIGAS